MLNGKKTWLGGIALIITGLGRIAEAYYGGGMPAVLAGDVLNEALASIGAGIGIIGVGHKLVKQDAAAVERPKG